MKRPNRLTMETQESCGKLWKGSSNCIIFQDKASGEILKYKTQINNKVSQRLDRRDKVI